MKNVTEKVDIKFNEKLQKNIEKCSDTAKKIIANLVTTGIIKQRDVDILYENS